MRLTWGLGCLLLLTGCGVLPKPAPPAALHDLGAIPLARVAVPWQVDVHTFAPAWLDDGQVYYRRGDETRLATYRDHRWAAPPSVLLARRLRDRLAPPIPGAAMRWLGVELVAFEQHFADGDAPARVFARAFIRERRGGPLLASRDFALTVPAASADVQGGVTALAEALDRLSGLVINWLSAHGQVPSP